MDTTKLVSQIDSIVINRMDYAMNKNDLKTTTKIDSCMRAIIDGRGKGYENPNFGIFLLLSALVLTIILIRRWYRKEKFSDEHSKNFLNVVIWVVVLAAVFGGSYLLGWIHPTTNNGFFVSHGDFLLVSASLIAFIGAFWAIFARIDAEKAFIQARATYQAFGDSFEFKDIFKKNIIENTLKNFDKETNSDSFGKPDTSIYMFLGFPCIGCFADDNAGFKDEPISNFIKFVTALELLASKAEPKFKLYLSILSKENSIKWLEAKKVNKDSSLYKKVLYFYDNVLTDIFTKKIASITILTDFDEQEKLRFILVEDAKSHNSTGFIWILPDFKKDVGFSSGGFKTNDTNLVSVLKSVFLKKSTEPDGVAAT